MDLRISGKRALITGATTGIGRATALALAAEGARVAIAGRNEALLSALRDELASAGAAAPVVIAADITTADGIANVIVGASQGLGGVDILVNNAGGSRPRPGAEANTTDDEWWDESFALNFTAARRITEGLLPGMKTAGWGRIVTLTGAMTARRMNAASPAKAALWSWSRSLSAELAADGITVNCIAPGRINTPQIVNRLFPTEEARRTEIDQSIPMGRFGEPEELAALVAFLASEAAGYITGTQIPVDGGMIRMAMP
ncbi:Putative short-chain dehydrogenase/reductase SDR [alpha proteobacterium BAL199]|jgi:3-oxoacyl-[acyl-carrier protein] reductase|nr:Putative short-chain dehydrogenase/reductase SDR [alpha proteobacterium BAL199]